MTLDSILVKPAGPDCDLACAYCFYRHKGFFGAGKHRMPDEVLSRMLLQFLTVSGPHVSVGWQGGEPTLMGLAFFGRAVELEKFYGDGKTIANGLQTSGVHIDRAWALFLKRYRFLVGLSIDGPREIHDHYRLTAGGGPTWARVRDAAKRLLDAGVPVNALTVVNDHTARFPDEIYEHHRDLGLAHMQFIPCLEQSPGERGGLAAFSVPAEAYGAFLCTLFDRWLGDFRQGAPTTSIRFFESLLLLYAGITPPDCTLLQKCGTCLVVEHNGDVFPCDFFVEPAWHLGNILHDGLGDLLHSARQAEFGSRKSFLPGRCRECRWFFQCRGGCTKDRLVPGQAGRNYFCESYRQFFSHADPELRRLVAEYHRKEEDNGRRNGSSAPSGKVGRNEPCPCGSGRKFKKCCGSIES